MQPEIQKYSTLVNKEQIKFLTQLQLKAPTLKAGIKIHKEKI